MRRSRGRGRADKGNSQAKGDQFHRNVFCRAGPFRQVLCMVEDEAEGDLFVLGPVKRLAERGHLPGCDIGQVPLPGAQSIGRRTTALKIGQRGLVGFGKLRIGG